MKVIPNELKIKLMTLNSLQNILAKNSFLLVYMFFITSCHSFKAIDPVSKIPISKSFLSFFDTCYPSEGGRRIMWLKEEAPLAEGRLDWIASHKISWQTQLSDPFGMILLDLKWSKTPPAFRQEGKLMKKIPELAVNKEGFWQANDVMVGLKAEEIPCLLKGKFPISWRDMIYEKSEDKNTSTFYISEASRKIDISFQRASKGSKNTACALFQWNQFLGIKTGKINWCITRFHEQSRLDMPGEHTLIWENSDA